MKGYIEERTIELANYIVTYKATVRDAAKKYNVSKSTVHMVVTNSNGSGTHSHNFAYPA